MIYISWFSFLSFLLVGLCKQTGFIFLLFISTLCIHFHVYSHNFLWTMILLYDRKKGFKHLALVNDRFMGRQNDKYQKFYFQETFCVLDFIFIGWFKSCHDEKTFKSIGPNRTHVWSLKVFFNDLWISKFGSVASIDDSLILATKSNIQVCKS